MTLTIPAFGKRDIVRLHRAAGPEMVVSRIVPDNCQAWERAGEVECVWFVQGSLKHGCFDPKLLDLVERASDAPDGLSAASPHGLRPR